MAEVAQDGTAFPGEEDRQAIATVLLNPTGGEAATPVGANGN